MFVAVLFCFGFGFGKIVLKAAIVCEFGTEEDRTIIWTNKGILFAGCWLHLHNSVIHCLWKNRSFLLVPYVSYKTENETVLNLWVIQSSPPQVYKNLFLSMNVFTSTSCSFTPFLPLSVFSLFTLSSQRKLFSSSLLNGHVLYCPPHWSFRASLLFCDHSACELYGLIGGIFGLMSINTMAMIAIDRYNVIARPIKASHSLSYRKAFIMIVLVWVWSLVWTLPPLFGWGAYIPEGFQTSCTFDYLTRNDYFRWLHSLTIVYDVPTSAIHPPTTYQTHFSLQAHPICLHLKLPFVDWQYPRNSRTQSFKADIKQVRQRCQIFCRN